MWYCILVNAGISNGSQSRIITFQTWSKVRSLLYYISHWLPAVCCGHKEQRGRSSTLEQDKNTKLFISWGIKPFFPGVKVSGLSQSLPPLTYSVSTPPYLQPSPAQLCFQSTIRWYRETASHLGDRSPVPHRGLLDERVHFNVAISARNHDPRSSKTHRHFHSSNSP